VTDLELIEYAESRLNSQRLDEGLYVADVGCALLSESDEVFTGACIGGHLGVHAEQSAFTNLVSKSGPTIKKIVAVWRDADGSLHIIPPCGHCREFMRMLSQDNLGADVIIGNGRVVKLSELLPYPSWYSEKVSR
jgi:cytidine deaminase